MKDALMANTEKFLMEPGNGFAFMGREVRPEIDETEKFIDLLFYNVQIRSYIVVGINSRIPDVSRSQAIFLPPSYKKEPPDAFSALL